MHDLKINLRMFKLLHSFCPSFFPLRFFQILISELSFYFNLWISAEIVTALTGARDTDKIWFLVAVALGGNLTIRLLISLLTHFADKAERLLTENEKATFIRKTLSLDYDKLENPEIRNLRRKVQENSYINGYGSSFFMWKTLTLIRIFSNLAYSIILFAEMITSAAGKGFDTVSILLIIGLVAFFAVQLVLSRLAAKKAAAASKKLGDFMLEQNRLDSGYPGYQAGKDIRIYDIRSIIDKFFDKLSTENRKCTGEYWNTMFWNITAPKVIIRFFTNCLSYLFVCYYCISGVFPIGSVVKYVGYLGRFMTNLVSSVTIFNEINTNTPFLETYLEFFDLKNDMYQGSLSVEKRSDKQFDVEFKNVSFSYPDSNELALKNISFKFRVGERLAVVGMNGSGKTTLIKLLCRLYDPTEGEIIMNDFNVRKYDYRQYLELFSVVFQDYNLLSFSLGQNVATDEKYDAPRAEEALRGTGFGERLDSLKHGLDTNLYKDFDAEGVEVSGGEAQKIALARALYRNAPFIILDEPTAALDPLAEADIYSRFNDIVGDKTAIYISHRLSSCRFCDRILVLDKGEIVQYGTHEELISDKSGKYRELWTAQAQHYTETAR